MKKFRLVDNILGWVAFLIAAFTYVSTIDQRRAFGIALNLSQQVTNLR